MRRRTYQGLPPRRSRASPTDFPSRLLEARRRSSSLGPGGPLRLLNPSKSIVLKNPCSPGGIPIRHGRASGPVVVAESHRRILALRPAVARAIGPGRSITARTGRSWCGRGACHWSRHCELPAVLGLSRGYRWAFSGSFVALVSPQTDWHGDGNTKYDGNYNRLACRASCRRQGERTERRF